MLLAAAAFDLRHAWPQKRSTSAATTTSTVSTAAVPSSSKPLVELSNDGCELVDPPLLLHVAGDQRSNYPPLLVNDALLQRNLRHGRRLTTCCWRRKAEARGGAPKRNACRCADGGGELLRTVALVEQQRYVSWQLLASSRGGV
jgi:hypothetical protein